jgi:hypothetical protein
MLLRAQAFNYGGAAVVVKRGRVKHMPPQPCHKSGVTDRPVSPVYGFALGEKNPIGKSFAVRSPAGASRITGIELTATDAVAMSP